MNQVQQFIEYILSSIKIWIIVQPWETGIRVRNGKKLKKLSKGIYFRLPYFDSVFIQESRLRIVALPLQTLTTKDLKTITLNGSIGYSIKDIEKLYDTLFHPETTIQNIAMAKITSFVYDRNLEDINIDSIEKDILSEIKKLEYGIDFEYFKVTNFAVVKTFRLIQDLSWVSEGLEMNSTK